jgi:RNA polymerase-binding protein DksA
VNTDSFRDLLLTERKRVADAISYLHEENSRSIEDETEEETFDNHIADSASITLNREIDTTLEENSEHVLRAIDAALNRIADGTFGTCVRCGKPIAVERLEAMPYATKCIECKRLEERG